MADTRTNETSDRITLALIGALAGLSAYFLMDYLPDVIENQRLLLWLIASISGFFAVLVALLGPLNLRNAVAVASVLSLSAGALFFSVSGRYLDFDDVFEQAFAPFAWTLLLIIGAPFGAAVVTGQVRDYRYLFQESWGIFVRYMAAGAFTGLFWAVLFLSDALLEIVGITLIMDLIETEGVPFVLTGTVVGLALSVAFELRAYVSPYLILRLLRLLLPMVLVVVSVFILALPLRGLSKLFGDFSAAGILTSVASFAIVLITSALDQDDEDAIASKLMIKATQLLVLLLPILSGLAVWAVWLRVAQYGWTPERLAAGVAVMVVFAYAVFYTLSLLKRSTWTGAIRQANIGMAIAVIVIAALWLSPVLNAERITANNQLNRYLAGKTTAENFPAWEMQNLWGIAGQKAIARLEADTSGNHELILASLARAKDTSRWEFQNQQDAEETKDLVPEFLTSLTNLDPESDLDPDMFKNLSHHRIENLMETCEGKCLILQGSFGKYGRPAAFLFLPETEDTFAVEELEVYNGTYRNPGPTFTTDGDRAVLTATQLEMLKSGQYQIAPSSRQSLWIGDLELSPDN